MNNLALRILTSIVGAAIMIGAILWNDYSCAAILLLLSFAVHFEYMTTVQNLKSERKRFFEWLYMLVTGIFIYCSLALTFLPVSFELNSIFLLGFVLIAGIFIFELFYNRQNPVQNIGLNITGLFYCIIPFLMLFVLGSIKDPEFILGYFLIIWSNDIFSYFTGRLLGKRKLFERISPNKTWEGFFGGMAASVVCAFSLSNYFEFLSRTDWLAIGFIISIFGTLGDLVESMLKRSVQIKDSSSILPGHGGFLDRFDGTLLAAPAVFAWLMLRL